MSHRFTTTLEEDDFGDLILTIPYEICEELGWNIGTDLDYDIVDNESFVLKKQKMSEDKVKVPTEQVQQIADSLSAINECIINLGERVKAIEDYVY